LVDFAGRNKLTRIVNGPRLEGETPPKDIDISEAAVLAKLVLLR
jgi:hypothetical protein